MSGTRMPCKSGYLRAKARLAMADSASSRTLAGMRTARPVARPPNVAGAIVTTGLLRMALHFPSGIPGAINARAPSTTMLTGRAHRRAHHGDSSSQRDCALIDKGNGSGYLGGRANHLRYLREGYYKYPTPVNYITIDVSERWSKIHTWWQRLRTKYVLAVCAPICAREFGDWSVEILDRVLGHLFQRPEQSTPCQAVANTIANAVVGPGRRLFGCRADMRPQSLKFPVEWVGACTS